MLQPASWPAGAMATRWVLRVADDVDVASFDLARVGAAFAPSVCVRSRRTGEPAPVLRASAAHLACAAPGEHPRAAAARRAAMSIPSSHVGFGLSGGPGDYELYLGCDALPAMYCAPVDATAAGVQNDGTANASASAAPPAAPPSSPACAGPPPPRVLCAWAMSEHILGTPPVSHSLGAAAPTAPRRPRFPLAVLLFEEPRSALGPPWGYEWKHSYAAGDGFSGKKPSPGNLRARVQVTALAAAAGAVRCSLPWRRKQRPADTAILLYAVWGREAAVPAPPSPPNKTTPSEPPPPPPLQKWVPQGEAQRDAAAGARNATVARVPAAQGAMQRREATPAAAVPPLARSEVPLAAAAVLRPATVAPLAATSAAWTPLAQTLPARAAHATAAPVTLLVSAAAAGTSAAAAATAPVASIKRPIGSTLAATVKAVPALPSTVKAVRARPFTVKAVRARPSTVQAVPAAPTIAPRVVARPAASSATVAAPRTFFAASAADATGRRGSQGRGAARRDWRRAATEARAATVPATAAVPAAVRAATIPAVARSASAEPPVRSVLWGLPEQGVAQGASSSDDVEGVALQAAAEAMVAADANDPREKGVASRWVGGGGWGGGWDAAGGGWPGGGNGGMGDWPPALGEAWPEGEDWDTGGKGERWDTRGGWDTGGGFSSQFDFLSRWDALPNVALRSTSNAEEAEVVFEPSRGAGEYLLYYLPHAARWEPYDARADADGVVYEVAAGGNSFFRGGGQGEESARRGIGGAWEAEEAGRLLRPPAPAPPVPPRYLSAGTRTASAAWLAKVEALAANDSLPSARLLSLQARTHRDSPDEMESPATQIEVARLLASASRRNPPLAATAHAAILAAARAAARVAARAAGGSALAGAANHTATGVPVGTSDGSAPPASVSARRRRALRRVAALRRWRRALLSFGPDGQAPGGDYYKTPPAAGARLTAQAVRAARAARRPPAVLVFAESREWPLKSECALPQRWALGGGGAVAATVRPGEYFAFQLGVWAPATAATVLNATLDSEAQWEQSAGGSVAPFLDAFSLRGTSHSGAPLSFRPRVRPGCVRSLWLGIQAPAAGFSLRTSVTLTVLVAGDSPAVARVAVPLSLSVGGPPLADFGDSDGWRLSRLRWLNSQVAATDQPTEPFTPVTFTPAHGSSAAEGAWEAGRGLLLSARMGSVEIGTPGLPAQLWAGDKAVKTGRKALLASPITFEVSLSHPDDPPDPDPPPDPPPSSSPPDAFDWPSDANGDEPRAPDTKGGAAGGLLFDGPALQGAAIAAATEAAAEAAAAAVVAAFGGEAVGPAAVAWLTTAEASVVDTGGGGGARLRWSAQMESAAVRVAARGGGASDERPTSYTDWEPLLLPRGALSLSVSGSFEFDAQAFVTLMLTASVPLRLSDASLVVPLDPAVAKLLMGLGLPAGELEGAAPHTWRWRAGQGNHMAWLGCARAGVRLKLSGGAAAFESPQAILKESELPPSWHNAGHGRVHVSRDARLLVRTGPRALRAGEALAFSFELLLTPCRPGPPWGAHFRERYHQVGYPDGSAATAAEVGSSGATALNVHQGVPALNPYINYVQGATTAVPLRQYAAAARAAGVAHVGAYYTVRELSTAAPELWPLLSLGSEVLLPGRGGGDAWQNEHLARDSYAPCWQCPLSRAPTEADASFDGGFDSAVCVEGLSRLSNWYVAGVAAALDPATELHLGIDAVYYDGVGFSHTIMRRVRRLLDQAAAKRGGGSPGRIDLHCGNNLLGDQYGKVSPALQFMGLFPYVDSLWLGEGASYEKGPAYWLVEVSGVAFGLAGDTMKDQDVFKSMLFGMAPRPSTGHPQPLWRLWDAIGLGAQHTPWDRATPPSGIGEWARPPSGIGGWARTEGWWEEAPAVVVECAGQVSRSVLATAFPLATPAEDGAGCGGARALLVVASWAEMQEECSLRIDAAKLGLNADPSSGTCPGTLRLWAPLLSGVQPRLAPLPLEEAPARDAGADSFFGARFGGSGWGSSNTGGGLLRSATLPVAPGGGWMLILDRALHEGAASARGAGVGGAQPEDTAAAAPPVGLSTRLATWQLGEAAREEARLELERVAALGGGGAWSSSGAAAGFWMSNRGAEEETGAYEEGYEEGAE